MRSPGLFLVLLLALATPFTAADVNIKVSEHQRHRGLQTRNDDYVDDYYDDYVPPEFDFFDTTIGYCRLDELDQIVELSNLIDSDRLLVDQFLEIIVTDDAAFEVAIRELRGFANLVRRYAQDETISDRDALESVMNVFLLGPETPLTQSCVDAIFTFSDLSVRLFQTLMGANFLDSSEGQFPAPAAVVDGGGLASIVADFSALAAAGVDMNQLDGTLVVDRQATLILELMRLPGQFERWRGVTLADFDSRGIKRYFNQVWRERTTRWEVKAISAVPAVARTGATYLALFEQLRERYGLAGVDAEFQAGYDATVALCDIFPPTPAPTQFPTLGPMGVDEMLGVVAVADETEASAEEISASWRAFRDRWPNRFFCLLQIAGFDSSDLEVPVEFALEGPDKKMYSEIRIDDGNPYFQSNWYDLCDFYRFEGGPVNVAPVYLGLPASRVEASLRFFVQMVEAQGGEVISAEETEDDNWIDPLNREFVVAST